MGFAQESGYTPSTIGTILEAFRVHVNAQFGTSYTAETFVGTGFYKYFYAQAQLYQANEIVTSEIFTKLQLYIEYVNARISRPVVTNPGLIEAIYNETGYRASVKAIEDADAGKIFICVDVDEDADDYAAEKLAICTVIKDSTVAGGVTQGAEVETMVLSNGQSFDFKYDVPDRTEVWLKLTTVLSDNNQVVIGDPDEVKALLMANIAERYALGKNFEPQRYFDVATDAPWAQSAVLEYSVDSGSNWLTAVAELDYDELFVVLLANVQLIES